MREKSILSVLHEGVWESGDTAPDFRIRGTKYR